MVEILAAILYFTSINSVTYENNDCQKYFKSFCYISKKAHQIPQKKIIYEKLPHFVTKSSKNSI